MLNLKKALLASAISTALFSAHVFAEEKSFMEAIKDSTSSLTLRLAVEDASVDTATGDLEATATTLLSRLTFSTGAYQGFSGLIEMDHVSEVFNVDYNTGPGGQTFDGEGAVLDPEGTDLNQAYLQYVNGGTTVKYGRQRIVLDNQRFVGGVAWRQNEQTYDGLSVQNTSVDNLKVFASYIYNVNRIFGDDRAAGDSSSDTFLVNANYSFGDIGSLTGYAYIIDNQSQVPLSSDTYGLRFTGASSGFGYTAEYATQSEGGDREADYSADYLFVEGSYSLKPVKFTIGYELLGADGADGQFITPLATLHKFNGWSDRLLGGGSGNILGGIEDTYVSVGSKFGPVSGAIVYHKLASDDSAVSGLDDLGEEIGLVAKGKAGPVGLLFKAAYYDADDFASDTTIFWLRATTKI